MTATNARPEWDEAMLEQLIRLWNEGLTATEIGEIFNKTRNAIIGKLSRLRNAGNEVAHRSTSPYANKPRPTKKPAAQKVKRRVADQGEKRRVELPPPPVSLPPIPEPLESVNGWNSVVSEIFHLKDRDCRFPLGEPMTGFCRAKAELHSSYCAYHRGIISKKPNMRAGE